MKKILALLMTLCLALSATAALATEAESLDVKLSKQLVNGSGFKLKLAFEEGSVVPSGLFDEATQLLVQNLVLRGTLQADYLKTALASQRNKEDLNITFQQGDQAAASFRYRSDGTLEALTTSLIKDKEYAAATGESFFLQMMGDNTSQWPGVERVLYAIYTADNEWRTAAEALAAPYMNDLSAWMQKYTDIKTVTAADGTVSTTTTLTIAPAEVKAQAKALLTRFFADQQLLTLMKEKMPTREANVFLNPAMQDSMLKALDALPLEDNVVITRAFGKDGTLVLDDVLLPMAGANGLKQAHYVMSVQEDAAEKTQVVLDKADGAVWEITFTKADPPAPTYAGRIALTPKAPAEGAPAAEADTPKVFDFTLTYTLGDTIYARLNDRYTAQHTALLTITPEGKPTHTLQGEMTMDSGNNRSSATNIKGTIVWTVQGSDSKLTANVTGGSTAPWAIPQVNAVNAVRLDSLTPEELKAEKDSALQQIQAAFAQMMVSLLPQPTAP